MVSSLRRPVMRVRGNQAEISDTTSNRQKQCSRNRQIYPWIARSHGGHSCERHRAQSSSTSGTWPSFRTPVLLRNTKARRARRAVAPVAGNTSPTPPRPSGSGRANTMWHITLPPSMEAVMTEYRD
ncbi:hypothetical protein CgunFtcFv8_003515 [Champsocephalus gunnari]|uniref:Uncharacterized protein n=1 Tax=Champsocephalus gunnari TaxID=52237 RepID=A0AAN8HWL7_CHAGU|nr:hypothetical protein CgunFtcFv8_003515 [Champsocephalus gunnari]